MRKVCHTATLILLVFWSTQAGAHQGAVTGVTLSPTTVERGATVTATVTGTSGACGAVHINWGDGDAVTHATEYLPVTKTHVYGGGGTFTVRAQGMGNCTGEASARVTVKAPPAAPPPPASPPAPQLTAVTIPSASVEPGSDVSIRLEGSGACPVALDFGDGTRLELDATLPTAVKHPYKAAGRYTIIATPAAPCTERRTAVVDVGRKLGGQISGVEIRPAVARPDEPVTITVNGSGTCKIVVDFDDGQDRRVTERLPYRFTYRFPDARQYEIVAWTDEPCSGSGEAIVRVRR